MGSSWRELSIAEMAEVIGGGTPSTKDPENFSGGISWVTPKDLSGYRSRYIDHGSRDISQKGLKTSSARLLPEGTVLLSTRAPVGFVAIASKPLATNQGFRSLLPKPGFDSEFIYYLLKANVDLLKSMANGSTFGELSGSTLKRLVFRVPEHKIQREIAQILGALDDKIELNRRMNETLEEMARALFKCWFVDFEPVRLKAKGIDPSLPPEKGLSACGNAQAGGLGLDPEIAALFPDSFVDSELGEIPAGWCVVKLGDLSQKPQYGYTASANDDPVSPKFLRITDINKQPWIEWASVPHCEITEEDFHKYRVFRGDILIARMADPGHGVMIEENVNAVFASYLIRFRPLDARHCRYIQYWLRSDYYWDLVASRGAGTTRVSLNAKVLGGIQMVIPPAPLAEAFGSVIDSFRTRVVANVRESESLTALRDALLPKLINSGLPAKNTERTIQEAIQ